jgi:phytoene dehydrogenase-like protein
MAKSDYDVIVVGAGFGGSSCAGLLTKQGLKVLLLEKNARAAHNKG